MSASTEPSVTCWGAAQTVTGSLHVLEVGDHRVLLDCGLFQGRRADAHRRNGRFPFHPHQIDAVLLSHAHIDHCGNLPNLVRQGYLGPIYCTPPTRDLAEVMLADAAKVQEEDAMHLNILRHYAEPWAQPLYTGADAARAARQCVPVSYGDSREVVPGVTFRFHDAGHLLGSAMIALEINGRGPKRTVTYTGDLGRPGLPVLQPPESVPPADLVLSESTYGGRCHPDVRETVDRLADAITRTADRGGKILIPAFGLGRTQLVVYYLQHLRRDGRIPDLPIFVDSPLASAIADVYRLHPDAFRADVVGSQVGVRYVPSFDESMKIADRTDPCIVIAASGMCEAGRIVQHLARNVGDERACVILVSYQAPRTVGRQLLDRPPTVHFLAKDWPLRAEVVHLEGFSGHADHDDLLNHLAPLAGRVRRLRLIHGEASAAEVLAAELRNRGFGDVGIPTIGERVPLAD